MRYFPVFMDLRNRMVVVVGGGEEALRKIRLLSKTEAKIEVVAPEVHPEIRAMPGVAWISTSYRSELLKNAALVLSADPDLNASVSLDALKHGIPFNAVDQADISTFIVPSIVDRDPVVVAIGTEGTAPVLAQALRARIDSLLPPNLGTMAKRAAALRQWVATKIAHGAPRRAFWHDFFFGDVADAAHSEDAVAFELAVGDSAFNAMHSLRGRVTFLADIKDPEMITLKAQRRLMEADVIVHDDTSTAALLEMARRDAVRSTSLTAAHVKENIRQGRNVVVLSTEVDRKLMAILSRAGLQTELLGHQADMQNVQTALSATTTHSALQATHDHE